MGDDIAQLCQLEFEGIKYVIKGTVEAAMFIGRLMRAVFGKGENAVESIKDKSLKVPGEKKSLTAISLLSEGGAPQAINVRDINVDDLKAAAKDAGLHWYIPIDTDPNDHITPMQVPAQEVATYKQLIDVLTARQLEKDKRELNSHDSALAELKEKLNNAIPGSDEAKALEIQIENLSQARDEAKKWVDYGEEVLATPADKFGYSIQEFLQQCKNTDLESDPEIARAEMDKGVEIGPKISAKECLQPIRDKSLMPDSKIMFYVPEIGAVITRDFNVDEKTNLVYSDYTIKTQSGEIMSFSDRNMTKADWNDKVLPDLLQNAGVLEGTLCRAFNDQAKLERFLQYHNKLENPTISRVSEKAKSGEQVFSSAEAKSEILNAVSEQEKGFASARVDSDKVEIYCTPEMFTNRGGKLDFKVQDDEHLQFNAASVTAELGTKGMIKLTIDSKSMPVFIKEVGEAKTMIPITLSEAKRRMDISFKDIAKDIAEVAVRPEVHGR